MRRADSDVTGTMKMIFYFTAGIFNASIKRAKRIILNLRRATRNFKQ